jgi:hypothetical protein
MDEITFEAFDVGLKDFLKKVKVPVADRQVVVERLWDATKEFTEYKQNLAIAFGDVTRVQAEIAKFKKATGTLHKCIPPIDAAIKTMDFFRLHQDMDGEYTAHDEPRSLDPQSPDGWCEEAERFKRSIQKFCEDRQDFSAMLLSTIKYEALKESQRRKLGKGWTNLDRTQTMMVHEMWKKMDTALASFFKRKSTIKVSAAKRHRIIQRASKLINYRAACATIKSALSKKKRRDIIIGKSRSL